MNGVIINLLHNYKFRQNLLKYDNPESPTNFIGELAKISSFLSTKSKINSTYILELIRCFFPHFVDFEFTLTEEVPSHLVSSWKSFWRPSTKK